VHTDDQIICNISIQHAKTKLNSMALVRERTIPTERPPPVGDTTRYGSLSHIMLSLSSLCNRETNGYGAMVVRHEQGNTAVPGGGGRTCPNITFPITNPTQIGLGLNPNVRRDWPSTNRLSPVMSPCTQEAPSGTLPAASLYAGR
jgi:hypothetical protein